MHTPDQSLMRVDRTIVTKHSSRVEQYSPLSGVNSGLIKAKLAKAIINITINPRIATHISVFPETSKMVTL